MYMCIFLYLYIYIYVYICLYMHIYDSYVWGKKIIIIIINIKEIYISTILTISAVTYLSDN